MAYPTNLYISGRQPGALGASRLRFYLNQSANYSRVHPLSHPLVSCPQRLIVKFVFLRFCLRALLTKLNLLIHLPVICVGLLKEHFDQFCLQKQEGMIMFSSKATTFWTGLVAKKGCRWKKVVAIKFLADKWREKSSCLAAPCVASNLHWRLCLVLASDLSD